MADYMQRVGAQPVELSVEGRNMVSVADKNAVGSRRAGWRVIARVEQKENVKGNEQRATYATEHVVKVGTELRGVRDGIFAPMDTSINPLASTGEPKVFYCKVKGDYNRFLVSKVAQDAADVPVVLGPEFGSRARWKLIT